MTDPDPSEPSDLAEREVLFNAYFDGELSDRDEDAFDQRLQEDPEFRAAYNDFAEVIDRVQNLPSEFAPDDFTDRVRDRIRTRSGGRFFGDGTLQRYQLRPHELAAAAMIIVMSSTYLLMGIPHDRGIGSEGPKRLEIPSQLTPQRPQAQP